MAKESVGEFVDNVGVVVVEIFFFAGIFSEIKEHAWFIPLNGHDFVAGGDELRTGRLDATLTVV